MRFILALTFTIGIFQVFGQTGICFTSAGDHTYAGPNKAVGLTSGDFNNDGIPDLATGTQSGTSVMIFYGEPGGELSTPVILEAGARVNALAATDFNMDGKTDLITANQSFDATLFLNGGSGLNARVSVPVGKTQTFVVTGDFNNDSKPDVVFGDANYVALFLGDGTGNFTTGSTIINNATNRSPEITDVNSDGKKDLLVPVYFDNVVTVLLGNGTDGFTNAGNIAVGATPLSVASGDFNSDGKADAAVVNGNDNSVNILLGNGGGAFSKSTFSVASSCRKIVARDFNKDGKVDLALASINDGQLTIYNGNGAGAFVKDASYLIGEDATEVVPFDLNVDSNLDLAVVNFKDGDISMLLSSTPGKFVSDNLSPLGSSTTFNMFRIADLNGDGMLDFATADGTDQILISLATSPDVYAAPVGYPVGNQPRSLAIGDLNGDAKPDVVSANYLSNSITILINNGNGTFTSNGNKANGTMPTDVVIKDMDNDGKPDILTSNFATNPSFHKGNGNGTVSAFTAITANSAAMSLRTGDFNNDGKEDIVTVNYGSPGHITFVPGSGSGTFLPPTSFVTADYPESVTVADFNLDGNLDVATGSYATSGTNEEISILLGNGSGGFAPYKSMRSGRVHSISVAAGDFNADGKPDIASANLYDNSFSVYQGKGDGTFQAAQSFRAGLATRWLEIADFNNDSKPDLAVLSQTHRMISVDYNTTAHITAAGPTIYCSGGSVVLNANTNGYSYRWNDGSTQNQILANKSAVYSVTIENQSGQCASTSNEIIVIVGPAEVPSSFDVSTTKLCAGSASVQYSVPNDRTVAYTWSYSATGATISGTGNSVSVSFASTATSGSLGVYATNVCGSSAKRSIAVTVEHPLPIPGAFSTSSASVCQDQDNVVYTIPNDPAVSYAWEYSGTGATIEGTGNSVSVAFSEAAASGKLSVVTRNTCGPSPARSLDIEVKPLPIIPSAFTKSTDVLCRGSSQVEYAVTLDPTVTYGWTYTGSGVVINGTTNAVNLDFSNSATTGDLNVKATNSCGTSSARSMQIVVEQPPSTPEVFTASTTSVCRNTTGVEYAVPNNPAVQYVWAYSTSGVAINGATSSVTLDFGNEALSGTLSVRGKNSCGAGAPRIVDITVNAVPGLPGDFTVSSSRVCAGQSNVEYAIPNDATLTYEWLYSGTGVSINATGGVANLSFDPAATGGDLRIIATNICGSSEARTLGIVVDQSLPELSFVNGGEDEICAGEQDLIYEVTKVDGASYVWSYTGNGVAIEDETSSASVDFSTSATSGELKVAASNGCGTSGEIKVEVTVNPIPETPTITKEPSGTAAVVLEVDEDADQYEWFKNDSPFTSTNSGELETSEDGSYSVKILVNGCESGLSDAINIVFVGLDDESKDMTIVAMYPNPAAVEIELQLAPSVDLPATVVILDSKGSELQKIQALTRKFRIPVSGFNDGLYLLEIRTQRDVLVRRFVKED